MLANIYRWFLKLTSRPGEKGEYSAGYWQNKVRQEALLLCCQAQGKALEIGCGEGFFLQALARENPALKIWGVDNNSQRLESAKRRLAGAGGDVHLVLQQAENLDFPDDYFERIICINVLFNLESHELLKLVFSQISRVCKKSGRIIFDFRNAANPILALKYKLAPYYDDTVKNLPLKTYRLREIETILKELNFRIINKKSIGFSLKRYAPVIIIEAEKIC